MPQQVLNPLSPYGRSGGVLLLNPTDRLAPARYGATAAQLRSAPVIRGTPPTYVPPAAAAITGINPNTGAVAGGTAVTITGTGFTEATGVTFDGIRATSVVVTPTSITCVTPPHAAGAVNVVVLDPTGNGTSVGGFTYA